MRTDALLSIRGLRVAYQRRTGDELALDGVSLDIERGEVLGVVGESGSGKSTLALAIAGLLHPPARVLEGAVLFEREDLLHANRQRLRKFHGAQAAIIFQDPTAALNPILPAGIQIVEALQAHSKVSNAEAKRRAAALLRAVGIPNATCRLHDYPHQMSGGMRQRLCIAIALICNPRLLIADEPTTALDVTVQAQVLDLLRAEQASRSLAMLLISHDFGVIARLSNRIAVLYAGRIVEQGPAADVLSGPNHPYTQLLLDARPRIDDEPMRRYAAIPGPAAGAPTTGAGCAFAERCPFVEGRCRSAAPSLFDDGAGHQTACWRFHKSHAEHV